MLKIGHSATVTRSDPVEYEGTTPEHHMARHATANDFANWQAQAAGMTNSELLWTVRDCQRAESAMRGWNPIKEGFYSDQKATYGMELTKRRQR